MKERKDKRTTVFRFEDFLSDPPTPEEEITIKSFTVKLGALESELAELRRLVNDAKSDARLVVEHLVEDATRQFKQRCNEITPITEIERVVHEKFEAEGNELAKAVYSAVLSKIQPHALR